MIKKEMIFGFYIVLTIILALLGYIFAKSHKYEYALFGTLLGILSSLLLWHFWGSKNTY
jgi:cytochrome c biogenesis protein CcdA